MQLLLKDTIALDVKLKQQNSSNSRKLKHYQKYAHMLLFTQKLMHVIINGTLTRTLATPYSISNALVNSHRHHYVHAIWLLTKCHV